ncbi:MAG: patatin-like phospholipase family protein [Gemmatimonadota bacterium]|nr:MAG: patatin-like phospholipase family protein [Gemmatimonadota bacterium]
MTEQNSTALILGGGGSKGAVQAGFLRAVEKLDIEVGLVVAASVGAVNGAFFAAGVPARYMVAEWSRLRRRDLFGLNWDLVRKRSRSPSVFSSRRLRRFLEKRLPVRRFDELAVPLVIVTTDLATGEPYLWDRGDLIEAILASCAVPGLLPPVRGPHGRTLIDGALSDNVPVEVAFRRGAGSVLGILCRTCAACRPLELGLAAMLGQAFGIAVDCKWRSDARRYAESDDVLIVAPEIGTHVQALDFSHGKELWQAGYRLSRPLLERWKRVSEAGALAKKRDHRVSVG